VRGTNLWFDITREMKSLSPSLSLSRNFSNFLSKFLIVLSRFLAIVIDATKVASRLDHDESYLCLFI